MTLYRQWSSAFPGAAVPGLALLAVGGYVISFELRLGRSGFDLGVGSALLGAGLLLAAVALWLFLRADKLTLEGQDLVVHCGGRKQHIALAELAVTALSIVPTRVFTVGARHDVRRTDVLEAKTALGTIALARGSLGSMIALGQRIASLPGSKVLAPTSAIELSQFSLDASTRNQLEGLARAFPDSEVGREAINAMGISRQVPHADDAALARRLSAEDAARRHARRHKK